MQLPLPIDGYIVEIPLTKGYVAIVDSIDADLALLKWSVHDGEINVKYARRHPAVINHIQPRLIWMHRVILERALGTPIPAGYLVDHKDRNGLNNKRGNLRLATVAQNQHNKNLASNNTSGVTGVYWNKREQKWTARIKRNGKCIHLGLHVAFDDAVAARHAAEIEMWGEFSPLSNQA
jgi:hypothetical protein